MNYNTGFSLNTTELSILHTALNEYVLKHINSEFTGVEFEDALCTKLKVILDVYKLKAKESEEHYNEYTL